MTDKKRNSPKGSDRRRADRVDTWLNASFQAGDSTWRMGYIRDISDTGAHIVTLEPLAPGERTAVLLENSKSLENVLVMGKVIWRIAEDPANKDDWEAPAMGIEFEDSLPVIATCFVQPDNGKKALI